MNRSLLPLRAPRALVGLAMALVAMLAVSAHGALDTRQTAARSEKKQQLEKAMQNLLAMPMRFEENRGQTDEMVKFAARGPGYSLFLTEPGPILALDELAPPGRSPQEKRQALLGMKLVGSNEKPSIRPETRLAGATNYIIGKDRSRWVNSIPNFGRVRYDDVYPGIDAIYYGHGQQLEYDFIVHPGKDPSTIRMSFPGSRGMELRDGALVLKLRDGEVVQKPPVSYQEVGGERRPVESSYRLLASNQVGFNVGRYDRSQKLIIDPVLTYSTFVGGSLDDYGTDIAIDAAGNTYVTGYTGSFAHPEQDAPRANSNGFFEPIPEHVAFPCPARGVPGFMNDPDKSNPHIFAFDYTRPMPDGIVDGFWYMSRYDAFVFKMNPTGTGLIYSSYLGSSGNDYGTAIAVDDAGSSYVTGRTQSTTFPIQDPIQAINGGSGDAFVTKFNAAGTFPIYSTYLGGNGSDWGRSIAVDPNRNAVVTGLTTSTNLPIFRAIQPAFGGGVRDQFVANINAAGTAFNYMTYWGGAGDEGGTAFDNWSPVPLLFNAFPRERMDLYLFDLTAAFGVVDFGLDYGAGVAVDSLGNAYVVGSTTSDNLFVSANAIQPARAGGEDAFITKFSPFGVPVYSSYLGGTGNDGARDVVVNSNREAYITGYTGSIDFPVSANAFQSVNGGALDGFLTRINTGGTSIFYSTYLGGSGIDFPEGIALNPSGNAYVTGWTRSPNFPIRNQLQGTLLGAYDGFLTKFTLDARDVEYSTYLGGTGNDLAMSVAVDSVGVAYLTGFTYSGNFPNTLIRYQPGFEAPGSRYFDNLTHNATIPLVEVFVSRIANPPLAPSNLQVINVTQTTVTLSWQDNADNETGFEIERKQGTGDFQQVGSVGANVLTFRDTGLIPGTLYTYRVRAINAEGKSAYSNQVAITTLPDVPAAPTDLKATAIDRTRIRVTWTDNANNEEEFQVERRRITEPSTNFVLIAQLGENVTTYDDSGLTPNTTYEYRVRANNVAGPSNYSNTAQATTLPDPPTLAPTDLTARPVSPSQIDLAWKYAGNDATGFKIERSDDNGVSFRVVRQSTDPAILTYSDTNLQPDKLYIYRVRAYNISGDGPASAQVSARTLKAPPTGAPVLTLTLTAPATVRLDWTDPVSGEDGFKVQRSRDNFAADSTTIAEVGAGVVSYTDSGLQPNTTYFYRILPFSRNSGGDSDGSASNIASIATIPLAPSGLTATGTRDTEITLTFQDNNPVGSDNPVNFTVERSRDNFAADVSTAGTATGAPGSMVTFVDTGLTANTTYWYRVRAFNASGESANSNVASATTLAPPPAAPTGLQVTTPPLPAGRTSLILNWTDNSFDETGFAIERSLGISGTFAEVGRVGAGVTSFTDTGLSPETTYFYRVKAIGPSGLDSVYSNVASGRTLPNEPPAPSNLQVFVPSAPQGIDTLLLSWSDNASNEIAYHIERSLDGANFTAIATVGPNITFYEDQGLTGGTTYFYRVRAENLGGFSPYSNIASGTTLPALPNAPENLRATVLSQAEIRLDWTDTANNEIGFSIERSLDGLTFVEIATVGADTTTYTDTGLAPNTTFFYRVRAFNISGFSAYTNTVEVTTAPGVASLILEVGSVKGGKKVKATVILGGPAPAGGVVVNLFSDSKAALVPNQITIPAGRSSGDFKVKTKRVRVTTVATISAEAGGVSASAQLQVRGRK